MAEKDKTMVGRFVVWVKQMPPMEKLKYLLTVTYVGMVFLAFFVEKLLFLAPISYFVMLMVFVLSLTQLILHWDRRGDVALDWMILGFAFAATLAPYFPPIYAFALLGAFGAIPLTYVLVTFSIAYAYHRMSWRQRIAYFVVAAIALGAIIQVDGIIQSKGIKNLDSLLPPMNTAGWIFREGAWAIIYLTTYAAIVYLLILPAVLVAAAVMAHTYEALLRLYPGFKWFTGYKKKKEGFDWQKYASQDAEDDQQKKQYYEKKYERTGYQQPPEPEPPKMPYEIKEAFEFMGLDFNCSENEFKKQFREKQKALHPDGKDPSQQKVYNDLTAQLNRKVDIIKRYKGW
jgi:hypothetical protein